MKTAEEWQRKFGIERRDFDGHKDVPYSFISVHNIKQIQLDAWRAGMTNAIEVCRKEAAETKDLAMEHSSSACSNCAVLIFDEIKNKTTDQL